MLTYNSWNLGFILTKRWLVGRVLFLTCVRNHTHTHTHVHIHIHTNTKKWHLQNVCFVWPISQCYLTEKSIELSYLIMWKQALILLSVDMTIGRQCLRWALCVCCEFDPFLFLQTNLYSDLFSRWCMLSCSLRKIIPTEISAVCFFSGGGRQLGRQANPNLLAPN